MPLLSLDCLTLGNVAPVDLIRFADKAGFDLISLWLQEPSLYPAQILRPQSLDEVATVLADTGTRVHTIEAFDLTTPTQVRAYRPSLELGARLGAHAVLAIHRTNPDRSEVVDALGCLAEMAREMRLAVNIEPIAMGYTRTLAEACRLIDDARVEAGIIFDTYHFCRAGGVSTDISDPVRNRIRHIQVCDAPASTPQAEWPMEAATDRLYPGEGVFPLRDLLASMPRSISWAIETPSLRRTHAGTSLEMQAVEAFDALYQLIANLEGHGASCGAR